MLWFGVEASGTPSRTSIPLGFVRIELVVQDLSPRFCEYQSSTGGDNSNERALLAGVMQLLKATIVRKFALLSRI